MAKDHRLDLGRYVTNPFNRRGQIGKNLNFEELFRSKPESGGYPWNPSRFTERDLTNRMMTRKRELNPSLNFVQNSPFFDDNAEVTSDYELFEGLGRFNRPESYDFAEGRALTRQRPEDQPDFNPVWVDAYRLSPTVKPGKAAKNPMPRIKNPDPNGYLLALAEGRAENEQEGKMSIAQLLDRKGVMKSMPPKQTEERQGQETANEAPEEVKQ
jgi:hypothetical protein